MGKLATAFHVMRRRPWVQPTEGMANQAKPYFCNSVKKSNSILLKLMYHYDCLHLLECMATFSNQNLQYDAQGHSNLISFCRKRQILKLAICYKNSIAGPHTYCTLCSAYQYCYKLLFSSISMQFHSFSHQEAQESSFNIHRTNLRRP